MHQRWRPTGPAPPAHCATAKNPSGSSSTQVSVLPAIDWAIPPRRRYNGLDAMSRLQRRLVLPHPHDDPTGRHELLIGVTVTTLIQRHLPSPILRVGACHRVVFRTSVPEAAIEEHGDPLTAEYQIRGPSKAGQWPRPYPVPQSQGMHCGAQGLLREGVSRLVAQHRRPNVRSRRPRTALVNPCCWRDSRQPLRHPPKSSASSTVASPPGPLSIVMGAQPSMVITT